MNIKFLTKALVLVGLISTLSFANMEEEDNAMIKKSGNKPTTMSCGAGKCGSDMMKPSKEMLEEGSMMKKSGNKETTMSCGAGKCGSSMGK